MDKHTEYVVPDFFPRNPLKKGAEQHAELRHLWSQYLSIPKGNPARKAFVDDLRQQYGNALAAFYTQSQGPPEEEEGLLVGQSTHQEEQEPPQKRQCAEPPPSPEPPLLPKAASSIIARAQATTHFTPRQVELSEAIGPVLASIGKAHNATVLDMRKAYEYWLTGKSNNKAKF